VNQHAWIFVVGSALVILLGVALIVYSIEFNKRRNRHLKEKDLMQSQFQQALLQSRLEIQEETFKKISQEIHDNIGQILTLVKLNLNTVELENNTVATEKIAQAEEMLTLAIQDLRDISKTLNSDMISRVGLGRAIELELQVIAKATGLKTFFADTKTVLHIDPQVELILFRIVQETVHNVIKHANATNVQVSIDHRPGNLLLEVNDDGIGYDTSNRDAKGSGLVNIESRCKLINANLEMSSTIGKGTRVRIQMELPTT
jgi:signal transduction histidine kinase